METVAVLLSTYNGQEFLKSQLESLRIQTAKNFHIYIRDDGSSDNTKNIIENFKQNTSNCFLLSSDKNLGAAKSFMELLRNVEADYYMFCDQDDVWLKNKIDESFKAIKKLENLNNCKPSLVFTDAQVVDADLKVLSQSFIKTSGIKTKFVKQKGYAYVTNISPGCTYIFNKNLRNIAIKDIENLPMHDWWLVLNAYKFGELNFLNRADILYRQHDNNVIGVHETNLKEMVKKIVNIKKTITLQYKQYQFLEEKNFTNSIISYYFYKAKFIFKTFLS